MDSVILTGSYNLQLIQHFYSCIYASNTYRPLQDREESTLVIEMWNSKEPITCMPQVNDAKGFAR